MKHNFKQHFKDGIKLIINTNGNPISIVLHLSKKQLFAFLDKLIPDTQEPEA
jgi:hypothetical protein